MGDYQKTGRYGTEEQRIKAVKVLQLPLKEGETLDTSDTAPQIYVKDSRLHLFNGESHAPILDLSEVEEVIAEPLLQKADVATTYTKTQVDSLVTSSLKGTAATSTNPGTPSSNVWYFANGAGTYTNFNSAPSTPITVSSSDGIVVLTYSTITGFWSKTIVQTPVQVADNLTTNSATIAASARQAKILAGLINGVTEVSTNYPIDFTALNSISGANSFFSNAVAVTVAGTLKSLRIKAVIGSTIEVRAYSISGSAATLLHTFPTWTTESLTETHTFADSYIIPAGAFLFVKSSGNIYFTNATGGYSLNTGNSTVATSGVKVSHDFTITEVEFIEGLTPKVSEIETDISSLQEVVEGVEEAVQSYAVDFTVLASTGGANRFYSNGVAISVPGRLKNVRIKTTIGSTVEVRACTVSGSTYTLLHAYPAWITAALEETNTFTDDYEVPAGAYIFVKSSSAVYYTGSATGYYITDADAIAAAGVRVSHDFQIVTAEAILGVTEALAEYATSIETLEVDVEELHSLTDVVLKPAILYKSSITTLADFTAVGWTSDGSGAVPSATGSANYLWLNRRYHVNPRVMDMDVTMFTNNIFYIQNYPVDAYDWSGGVFAVDMTTAKLIVYNRLSGVGGSLTQAAIGDISFTLVNGRKYNLKLELRDWSNIFSIRDTVTGSTFSITYTLSTFLGENLQADSYRFYVHAGTTSGFKIHRITISSKLNPLVMLVGDSITQGVYFANTFYPSTYGMLLKEALRGNLVISARGGDVLSMGPTDKVITEMPFIKPDYLMATIGTNAGLTNGALTTWVNNIIALGITPIINHIPNRGDNNVHLTANAVIDAVCLSTGAIRGALFDVATSIGNNPSNGYIVSYYSDNGVHPNVTGHQKMFERFAIDLPWLFI